MMPKQKISFWQFLFKIGDDYLMFLRNLTPVILFLSLALFALPHIRVERWNMDDVILAMFSASAFFIAASVMLVNLVSFAKKTLKALQILHNQEEKETEGCVETLKELWHVTNTKQLLFFLTVTVAAVIMVLIYGMNYAFNFYRTIASIAE